MPGRKRNSGTFSTVSQLVENYFFDKLIGEAMSSPIYFVCTFAMTDMQGFPPELYSPHRSLTVDRCPLTAVHPGFLQSAYLH